MNLKRADKRGMKRTAKLERRRNRKNSNKQKKRNMGYAQARQRVQDK